MARFIFTIVLLITAAIANYSYSKPEADIDRLSLKSFPKGFDEWMMTVEQDINDATMAVLLVDDYIMRNYRNAKGENIGLYIGYFNVQREGKQVHSPRQCLPGAGWNIIEKKEMVLGKGASNQRINYYLMGKGADRQIYLWWYHGRGRIYANEYLNKLYLIWDAITKRRTDGALVRINMTVQTDVAHTLEAQLRFVDDIYPILPQFIPN